MRKRKSQIAHARRRFGQRKGINFGKRTQEAFVKKIQDGQAVFVKAKSNRVSLFDVEDRGETHRVVYDKQRKVIVTVLFKEGDAAYGMNKEHNAIHVKKRCAGPVNTAGPALLSGEENTNVRDL